MQKRLEAQGLEDHERGTHRDNPANSILRLDTRNPEFPERFQSLVTHEDTADLAVLATVGEIIDAIRQRGDAALCEYCRRFDRHGWLPPPPRWSCRASGYGGPERLRCAPARSPPGGRGAHPGYHQHRRNEPWSILFGVLSEGPGNLLGQRVTPLERVGVYVPGGKAAYPSTVLMNVIPAKVAGVGEVIMAVPAPGGEIDPVVLCAAGIAGVDRVFTIGGAGDRGPGLWHRDRPARRQDRRPRQPLRGRRQGHGLRASWYRPDRRPLRGGGRLRRHGPCRVGGRWTSSPRPSTTNRPRRSCCAGIPDFIEAVAACIESRVAGDGTRRHHRCLSGRPRALIRVRDLEEALGLANTIAPEHLELAVANPECWLPKVRHAGAIFLGCHAAEVLSDCSPAPTTCFRPPARRASPHRSVSTTSRSAPR